MGPGKPVALTELQLYYLAHARDNARDALRRLREADREFSRGAPLR